MHVPTFFLNKDMLLKFKNGKLLPPPREMVKWRTGLTFDDLKVPSDETW